MVLTTVNGHVRLNFPKARMYDFDFLDNIRTRGPCGMPENATGHGVFKTKLITGSTIDITWVMNFPHNGGFRIQILHSNGSILHELTPTDNNNPWYSTDNSTIQNYITTLPTGFTCHHCIIRLLRNAREWLTANGPYIIWSCADVDINHYHCNQLNCYNGGSMPIACHANTSCLCPNHRLSGDRCQYTNECESNADCSNHGQCLTINQDYYYPLKQCYCSAGYYGYQCAKISTLTTPMVSNLSSYSYDRLDSKSEIWYKIIPGINQVEIIHKTASKSWVGLGWRPQQLKASCQFFPSGAAPGLSIDPTNADHVGANHPMDCTDMVIGSARGNTFRLFDYYARGRDTPRMDIYYGGVDSITAAVGSEVNGITTLRWRKKLIADGPTDHDIADAFLDVIYAYGQQPPYSHQFQSGLVNSDRASNYYGNDELKYHGYRNRGRHRINFYGDCDLITHACSGHWNCGCANNTCQTNLDWTIYNDATVHFTMSTKTDKWISLGISADKNMANTDAIVGWVSNNVAILKDRFIKHYAPPSVDSLQNVNLLSGSYINGVTLLKFYRAINTSDTQNDISLHGCHYFMFAIGGTYNNATMAITRHQSTPFVSSRQICIDINQCSNHYSPLAPNILRVASCSGSWGMQCLNGHCANNLNWNIYNDGTVHFTMSSRTNKWIGLAISDDKKMPNSDAIVGWVSNNVPVMSDRYIKSYRLPSVDPINNVHLVSGSYVNGITSLQFYRAINTSDDQNDISLHGCHYLMYAIGGSYNNITKDIGIHPSLPFITAQKVCMDVSQCSNIYSPLAPDMLTVNNCSGKWSIRCVNRKCADFLTWNIYNDGTVHFQMSAKTDKWIGLGISGNRKMPNSDAIVGWVSNGKATLTDRHLNSYSQSQVDAENNVNLVNGTFIDGITTLHFYRQMSTNDVENDINLHGCYYLFFAIGGNYNDTTLQIGPHPSRPAITKIQICFDIEKCTQHSPPGNGASTLFSQAHLLLTVLYIVLARLL